MTNRSGIVPLGYGAAVAGVAVIVLLGLGGSYNANVFTVALGYAIVTIGMSIQLGYSHQLAFSQSAFMGFGAYSVAILEVKYEVPVALAFLAAIVGAALVSLLMSAVLTRIAGLALALVTLLIPQVVSQLATFSHYLGSFAGISGVEPLWNGETFQQSLLGTGIVAALVLGLVTFIAVRILRSGVGLQLSAVAANESMAEGMGVSLGQRKVEVFVLGSVLAALGGAVVASAQNIVTPDLAAESSQLTLLVMLFVGGRRSVWGAVVGAVAIEYLSNLSGTITTNLSIIEGVLLLLVLLFEPDGLGGIVQRGWRAVRGVRSRTRPDKPDPAEVLAPIPARPDAVAPVGGGDSE
ncbi:MAG TPA: branched-chain amino acid ABC transporter permease [Pseudonocardiaceae bacterium]|nr:branched-chain amino acid ABC transporter permease [Pseudonocardiaceae bacterium]